MKVPLSSQVGNLVLIPVFNVFSSVLSMVLFLRVSCCFPSEKTHHDSLRLSRQDPVSGPDILDIDRALFFRTEQDTWLDKLGHRQRSILSNKTLDKFEDRQSSILSNTELDKLVNVFQPTSKYDVVTTVSGNGTGSPLSPSPPHFGSNPVMNFLRSQNFTTFFSSVGPVS